MALERKTLNEIAKDAKVITRRPLAEGSDTRDNAVLEMRHQKSITKKPLPPTMPWLGK